MHKSRGAVLLILLCFEKDVCIVASKAGTKN